MSRRLRQKAEAAPPPPPPPVSGRRKLAAAKAPPPVKGPRTMLIGTGSIISVIVLMLLLAGWGAGMTFVLVAGDTMSRTLIAQNSEMQDAYEQRLQAFRAEIARLTLEMEQSKFDQTSVEGRVIDLGRRQRLIESRLIALNKLSELVAPGAAARTAPIAPLPAPPALAPSPKSAPVKGGALEEKGAAPVRKMGWSGDSPDPAFLHRAQLGAPAPVEADPASAVNSDVEIYVERLNGALARSEAMQTGAMNVMVRLSEQRARGLRDALADVGLTPEEALQMRTKGGEGPSGGGVPAIVLPISEQNTPFAQRVEQIRQNIGLMGKARYLIESLPIYKPTLSEVRYSSPFGFRFHPILHIQKLHGGIDMAAPVGTQVRAAGSGVVLSASWGGGYGNLIQIDHGNGLISRYAHLSEIDVSAGQPVSAGAYIGKSGSTGASTGPHLHFETRIDNVPNNPACFMLAGDRVTGLSTMTLPCEKKPDWGKRFGGGGDDEDDDS